MNSETWEMTLPQSLSKTHDKAPDFTGEANLGTTNYEVAAWFGEISKGNNVGHPYIGLTLTAKSSASTQKINISLWEKQNRKTADDPHFKSTEEVQGCKLCFAAWIEEVGVLHQLKVRIVPFSITTEEMSEPAIETHERLVAFLKGTALRLTEGEPLRKKPAPAPSLSQKVRRVQDPDLDVEPGDLPF
jgi:hypothetical protein